MNLLRRTLAILWKDLLIEARTRGSFTAMAFFAGVVLLVFSFAIGPDPGLLRRLAGGLLWVAIVFTGLLSLGRSFRSEELSGGLEGLRLYPGEIRALFLGKAAANLTLLLLVEALLFPIAAVLFHMEVGERWPALAGVALLGTVGFSVIGTFYATLTLHLRARELLLPLLLLPLLVPVLLGAVNATTAILAAPAAGVAPAAAGAGDGIGGPGAGGWIRLLAAFDIIYFVLCTWIFPTLLER